MGHTASEWTVSAIKPNQGGDMQSAITVKKDEISHFCLDKLWPKVMENSSCVDDCRSWYNEADCMICQETAATEIHY